MLCANGISAWQMRVYECRVYILRLFLIASLRVCSVSKAVVHVCMCASSVCSHHIIRTHVVGSVYEAAQGARLFSELNYRLPLQDSAHISYDLTARFGAVFYPLPLPAGRRNVQRQFSPHTHAKCVHMTWKLVGN